jgi:hypothetical protein
VSPCRHKAEGQVARYCTAGSPTVHPTCTCPELEGSLLPFHCHTHLPENYFNIILAVTSSPVPLTYRSFMATTTQDQERTSEVPSTQIILLFILIIIYCRYNLILVSKPHAQPPTWRLHFVRLLPFDLSGVCGSTKSLCSHQHSCQRQWCE